MPAESREAFLRDETLAAIVALAIVAGQWWIMAELRIPASWALPGAATVLVGALAFVWVLPGERRRARRDLQMWLVALLVIANVLNLFGLGRQAFFDGPEGAIELLFTGAVLWTMNVLVFGLVYWLLDGGGPEVRAAEGDVIPDFVFPQQTDAGNTPPGWRPTFGDYLYLAFTGAIAFGPTDAMPYSRRAKAAMAIEGALALAALGVIIARAVSLAGE